MSDKPDDRDRDSPKGRGGKAISCLECRRLKLRCTRVWPCTMCVKRGLAHLCPNGVQQGERQRAPRASSSKLADADTSAISQRLASVEQKLDLLLSDRSARPSTSRQPSNGLYDLANIASDHSRLARDDDQATARQHGLLAMHADGRSSYLGPAAHSLYLARDNLGENGPAPGDRPDLGASRPGSPTPVDFEGLTPLPLPSLTRPEGSTPSDAFTPPDITSQPTTWATPGFRSPFSSQAIWTYLRPMLPPKQKAKRMIDVYFASVPFMHEIVSREELDRDLWRVFYSEVSFASDVPPGFSPERLSLLFAIFALGVLMDVKRPQRDQQGRALYSCAWNALAMANFTEKSSLETVFALIHITLYLSWRRAGRYAESAWPILELTMSILVRAGLHRDPGHFDLDEEERERRRRAFWDVQGIQVLRSLAFCRPPAIIDRHVDTQIPKSWRLALEESEPDTFQGKANAFHAVKCQITKLQNRILDDCLCATSSYSVTLDYENQIRRLLHSFPSWLRPKLRSLSHQAKSPEDDMERAYVDQGAWQDMTLTLRCHVAYLNIHQMRLLLHRGWFSEALQSMDASAPAVRPADGTELRTERLTPSLDAVSQSASALIDVVTSVWAYYPALSLRWMFFWNALFSAAVCRGFFAVKFAGRQETQAAQKDLQAAIDVVRLAVGTWKPLETPLGILERLQRRVQMTSDDAASLDGSSNNKDGRGSKDAGLPQYSRAQRAAQAADAERVATLQHEDLNLLGEHDSTSPTTQTSTPSHKASTPSAAVRGIPRRSSLRDGSEVKQSRKRSRVNFEGLPDDSSKEGGIISNASSSSGVFQHHAASAAAINNLTMPSTMLNAQSGLDILPSANGKSDGSFSNTGGESLSNQDLFAPWFSMPASLPTVVSGRNGGLDFMSLPAVTAPGLETSSANNASQLIQALSAGVNWDDLPAMDHAFLDL